MQTKVKQYEAVWEAMAPKQCMKTNRLPSCLFFIFQYFSLAGSYMTYCYSGLVCVSHSCKLLLSPKVEN